MKVSNTLFCVSLISLSLALGGCGNLGYLTSSTDDAAAISAKILEQYVGAYQMACDTSGDPIMDEFAFTASGNYVYTARDYDSGDTTCSGQPVSTLIYIFKPTFAESGTPNVHKIDIELKKVMAITSTPARTAQLQSGLDGACPSHGVTLREGMMNDLTGRCSAIAPDIQYSLIGLTTGSPNHIQIGDIYSGLDGSTPELRPTTLISTPIQQLAVDSLQAYRGIYQGKINGSACVDFGGAYGQFTLVMMGSLGLLDQQFFVTPDCSGEPLLRNAETRILTEGSTGTIPSDAIRLDNEIVSSYLLSTDASVTADQNAHKCGDTATTLVTNTVLNTSAGECGNSITGETSFDIIKNSPHSFQFGNTDADPSYDGSTALKRPQVYEGMDWVLVE